MSDETERRTDRQKDKHADRTFGVTVGCFLTCSHLVSSLLSSPSDLVQVTGLFTFKRGGDCCLHSLQLTGLMNWCDAASDWLNWTRREP